MPEQATRPLCRRMIEDLTIRKFVQKTKHDCVHPVKGLRELPQALLKQRAKLANVRQAFKGKYSLNELAARLGT